MSAPFDLSDALKTPPTPLTGKPGGKGGKSRPPVNVRLDEAARRVLWITLVLGTLMTLYLLWGLYEGTWASPVWNHQPHAFHLQQISNIATISNLLELDVIGLIVAMVIAFYQDEGAGFALLGGAAVYYFGVPLLTNQMFSIQSRTSSLASQEVLQNLQMTGLILGIPGLIWSIVDIVRRFRAAAEAALVRQANHKYGAAAAAHALGGRVPGRRLTPHQRKQRTYQWLSLLVVIGEPLLVYLNLGIVENWMQGLLALTNRLSFSTDPQGIAQLHGSNGTLVLWVLLIALLFVAISQTLRLLEYLCYGNTA